MFNIAKVEAIDLAQEIVIYPNPVTNRKFEIRINNFHAGRFRLDIIDNKGAIQNIRYVDCPDMGENKFSIQLPKFLADGIYRVRINMPGKKTIERSIHIINN